MREARLKAQQSAKSAEASEVLDSILHPARERVPSVFPACSPDAQPRAARCALRRSPQTRPFLCVHPALSCETALSIPWLKRHVVLPKLTTTTSTLPRLPAAARKQRSLMHMCAAAVSCPAASCWQLASRLHNHGRRGTRCTTPGCSTCRRRGPRCVAGATAFPAGAHGRGGGHEEGPRQSHHRLWRVTNGACRASGGNLVAAAGCTLAGVREPQANHRSAKHRCLVVLVSTTTTALMWH